MNMGGHRHWIKKQLCFKASLLVFGHTGYLLQLLGGRYWQK